MTLRARGWTALIVVVLVGAMLGGMALVVVGAANRVDSKAVDSLYPAGLEISEVLLATTDQESGVWGYALSSNRSFLTDYETGKIQAERGFDRLEELLSTDQRDLLPLLSQARTNWRVWMAGYAEPRIAEVSRGDVDVAREEIIDGAGRRVFRLLRSDLALLQFQVDSRVADAVDDISTMTRRLSIAVLATTLAAALVTAGAAAAMVGWVLKPLADLQAQMRRLSREHDTTTPLTPSGPPEIAALGRDAESLRQSLVSLVDDAAEAQEGLAQEGPTVATIRDLLRGPSDPRVPNYGLGVASLSSAGSVTGDWWDLIALPGGGSAIELCDISGHDADAGVVAVRFKAAVHVGLRGGTDPDRAVAQAAATFAKTPGRFASYLLVNLEPGRLRHLNAGHNPPVVVRKGGAVETLPGTGPLVTLMGGEWDCDSTEMHTGDVVVMYTDGLVEGRDEDDEEVGDDQVVQWCRELAQESRADPAATRAGYIAKGLLSRARALSVDLRRDDVTVVVAVAE